MRKKIHNRNMKHETFEFYHNLLLSNSYYYQVNNYIEAHNKPTNTIISKVGHFAPIKDRPQLIFFPLISTSFLC
jgi:hypothetical protein